MSRSIRPLLAIALAGAAFAGGGTASADGCYGVQSTLVACTANREIHRECVYTGGSTCKWVVVSGPLCVYGTIGSTWYFITAWC